MKIIAAVDHNYGIGKNGDLPWHSPEDLKNFKELTNGGIVIMGRGCYDSLPDKFKPLPNRLNIIMTRGTSSFDGCMTFNYVCDVLNDDYLMSKDDVWIIGGAQIYESFLPFVDSMILTHMEGSFDCDTFFPQFNEDEWEKEKIKDIKGGEIVKYTRIFNI
jgi:dihydrofolate reductase